MSIEKRRTKSGAVRYDVRLRSPDGRQYKRTFRTKKEAERFEASQHVEQAQGAWVDPAAGRVRFDEWSQEWFDSMRHTWRPGTTAKHRTALAAHWVPKFGHRELATITPREIQLAVNELADDYAAVTVRTYYSTLHSLFTAALEVDLLGRTPCRGVKLPAGKSAERRVVTPAELHRLADAIGPKWRVLVYLGGVMGLRFGEAIALQVADLDLENHRISITRAVTETGGQVRIGDVKTATSARTLAIPGPLADELRDHLERLDLVDETDLLFADNFGGPLRGSNFRPRIFRPATRRAGVPGLTFHGLRHSAATQWITGGIDVRTAQHRLGHSDPKLVLRLYAHGTTEADESAAQTAAKQFWPNSKF